MPVDSPCHRHRGCRGHFGQVGFAEWLLKADVSRISRKSQLMLSTKKDTREVPAPVLSKESFFSCWWAMRCASGNRPRTQQRIDRPRFCKTQNQTKIECRLKAFPPLVSVEPMAVVTFGGPPGSLQSVQHVWFGGGLQVCFTTGLAGLGQTSAARSWKRK